MQATAPVFSTPSPLLLGLQSLKEYQAQRPMAFPTYNALLWFERIHHAALIEFGAVLLIAGRTKICPEVMDRYVLEEGARAARRRSKREQQQEA